MRPFVLALVFCLGIVSVQASNNDFKVNGYKVYKEVTEITFEDANIVLKWNDNTTTSDYCAQTLFKLINGDHINDAHIYSASGLQDDRITLEGLKVGTTLYIYNLQGIMLAKQPVMSYSTQVNLSGMNTGIYFLKNQNTILKIVKR